MRKALLNELRRLVRDIEKYALRAGTFDLGVDRARYDVPRRERAARVVALHEIFAAIVPQNSAFSAHCFGNQKRFRLRMKQAGRMKLDELHVRDHRARAPRHRHAVARRDVRVCRVQINFSAAAGREHDAIRADRFHLSVFFIENVDAEATIFCREAKLARSDQIHRHVIFQKIDMRLPTQLAQQNLLDLLAGHVLHMQDAPFGVTAFSPKIELAMTGNFAFVKLQSKIDKFMNSRRSFRHNRANNFLVAKPGAGFERVAHMQPEGIFVARHAGDPALRPRCVRVRAFAFCDHGHRAMLGRFQRKTEPGNATANHDEIVFLHPSRMLSIKRVWPKKTASASSEFGLRTSIGCKLSASTRST